MNVPGFLGSSLIATVSSSSGLKKEAPKLGLQIPVSAAQFVMRNPTVTGHIAHGTGRRSQVMGRLFCRHPLGFQRTIWATCTEVDR
jgi:hypothetical protein